MKILDSIKRWIGRAQEDISSLLGALHQKKASIQFYGDIFDERMLNPHEEMRIARKMYMYNSLVAAATNTLVNFVYGDGPVIHVDDKNTKAFFEGFMEESGLSKILRKVVEDLIIFGNAYIEVIRDSKGTPAAFSDIPYPENIYIDFDEKGRVKRYIQKLPYPYTWKGAGYFQVPYYGTMGMISVYGVEIPADSVIHFKLGEAAIPVYGRSQLISSVNAYIILNELERDIAVLSRYKAIPKKIIVLPEANQKKAMELAKLLRSAPDDANLILTTDVKTVDLSYNGEDLRLNEYIDYVKKALTIGLAPQFMIHGDGVNRATSKDQMRAYMMTVASIRRIIADEIKSKVLIPIAKAHRLPVKGLKLEFKEFHYEEPDDKFDRIIKAYQAGLITLEEARRELGFDTNPPAGKDENKDKKEN